MSANPKDEPPPVVVSPVAPPPPEDGWIDEADPYEISWLDLEATKKIHGIFANRIYVQPLGDGMVRLNFGEVLDNDDPTYHTALVMTASQAESFARLIHKVSLAILGYTESDATGADNGG